MTLYMVVNADKWSDELRINLFAEMRKIFLSIGYTSLNKSQKSHPKSAPKPSAQINRMKSLRGQKMCSFAALVEFDTAIAVTPSDVRMRHISWRPKCLVSPFD